MLRIFKTVFLLHGKKHGIKLLKYKTLTQALNKTEQPLTS